MSYYEHVWEGFAIVIDALAGVLIFTGTCIFCAFGVPLYFVSKIASLFERN